MARIKETRTRYETALDLPPLHRFSVSDYHDMIAAGVFGEDDRVELINGEIRDRSPINALHAGRVNRAAHLIRTRLHNRVIVSVQNPIILPDDSEPQPDIAVLKPRDDFYSQAHPAPADVLLVIEVSESTLDFDRTVKQAMYASAGILEYWVINLPEGRLEVFREPSERGYRSQRLLWQEDSIAPLAFADVAISVSEVI